MINLLDRPCARYYTHQKKIASPRGALTLKLMNSPIYEGFFFAAPYMCGVVCDHLRDLQMFKLCGRLGPVMNYKGAVAMLYHHRT
jgi:hypothetical protein